MEQGSEKHSPRVDEEMDHEVRGLEQGAPVEPRAEEFREQEGAAEGQPSTGTRPYAGDQAAGTLPPDDIQARSELARSLEPSAFPGDRNALLAAAREQNAPEAVLARLRDLPSGVEFENVQAVWSALGGDVEPGPSGIRP